jgi:hypothetical protein
MNLKDHNYSKDLHWAKDHGQFQWTKHQLTWNWRWIWGSPYWSAVGEGSWCQWTKHQLTWNWRWIWRIIAPLN